jgi:multimeric flavodoxin WrbA
MPRLLLVHHTPSPTMHTMLEAVRDGATNDEIGGVELVTSAALHTTASDVLAADGYVIGSPANLGYLSGAVKHFFDTVYYPCLEETIGRPFGFYLHGNDDTAGARRAIERITTGLRWQHAAAPVELTANVDREARDALWELGATLAATLMPD